MCIFKLYHHHFSRDIDAIKHIIVLYNVIIHAAVICHTKGSDQSLEIITKDDWMELD
jgi:hypothetical protein